MQRYEGAGGGEPSLRGLRKITAGIGTVPHIRLVMTSIGRLRERVLVDRSRRTGYSSGKPVLDSVEWFGQVSRGGQLPAEVILVTSDARDTGADHRNSIAHHFPVGTGAMGRQLPTFRLAPM